jgi:hypothetical protein
MGSERVERGEIGLTFLSKMLMVWRVKRNERETREEWLCDGRHGHVLIFLSLFGSKPHTSLFDPGLG